MRHLVIDYIRRCWWRWLVCCVAYAFILGACVPVRFPISEGAHARTLIAIVLYVPVWIMAVASVVGVADPVVVASMPVSARNIGRARWMSLVGVPSVAIALSTCIAGPLSYLLGNPLPALCGFEYWVTSTLILGIMRTSIVGLPTGSKSTSRMAREFDYLIMFFCFAVFWFALYLVGFLYHYAPPESRAWDVFVAFGAAVTLFGWFRVETFARESIGKAVPAQKPAKSKPLPAYSTQGRGGISLLVQFMTVRMALIVFMFVGGVSLINAPFAISQLGRLSTLSPGVFAYPPTSPAEAHDRLVEFRNYRSSLESAACSPFLSFSSLGIVAAIMLVIPACYHLRKLRTLPISTASLAGVLVFTPLLVEAMLVAPWFLSVVAVFHWPQGSIVMLPWQIILQPCLFVGILVPLLVWRAESGVQDLFAFVVWVGISLIPICTLEWHLKMTFLTAGVLSLLLVCGSFVATKYLLERGSRVYRTRTVTPNPFMDWLCRL